LAQTGDRRAPHSRQNLAWIGFSCWHRGHFIELSRAASASFDYAMLKRIQDFTQPVTLHLASELCIGDVPLPARYEGTLNGKQRKGWMGGSTAPLTKQGLGGGLDEGSKVGGGMGEHAQLMRSRRRTF